MTGPAATNPAMAPVPPAQPGLLGQGLRAEIAVLQDVLGMRLDIDALLASRYDDNRHP